MARSGRRMIRVWQSRDVNTAVLARPDAPGGLRESVSLPAAYPNPAHPGVWIPYQIGVDGPVEICVYNVTGQLVRALRLGQQRAATYADPGEAAFWDGCDGEGATVAAGVYIYRVMVGGPAATGR
jgi:hypothetical protein